jgi:hypothetical protein
MEIRCVVIVFYFGVLHPVACTLSRLLEEPLQQLFKVFIYIYFALAGHLQGEYTVIFRKLPHYIGSIILCYRSNFFI